MTINSFPIPTAETMDITATEAMERIIDVVNKIDKAPLEQLSVAIGESWVNAAQVSGAPIYTYTEAAISAPGLMLFDNTDLSLVTQITISKEALNNAETGALFNEVRGGEALFVSDFLDNTNFLTCNVSGNIIESGLSYQIPVSVYDSGGSLTAGELTRFNVYPLTPKSVVMESLFPSTTNANYDANPQLKLIGVGAFQYTDAKITLSFECSASSINRSVVAGLFINGVLVDDEFEKEMKDSTDNDYITKTFSYQLSQGPNAFELRYGKRNGVGSSTVTIKNARIITERL